MGEDLFDDLARALAQPMPRRTALRVAAAGLVVAAIPGIRPRWAYAAAPPAPCSSGGTFCGNILPGGYNIGCCMGAGRDSRTVCCPGKPGIVGSLCCPTGYTCGNTSADSKENCKCASKVVCGGKCCKPGDYCVSPLFGDDYCDKLCPNHTQKCIGVCCTNNEECGFFGCGCKSGLVSTGAGTCVPPRQDPGDPRPANNPISNMLNMMGASSASHGGSAQRVVAAHPAQAVAAPVGAALAALAAVSGQGAAAQLAIRQGKRDPSFRQKVTVARAKPPALAAGAGFDAKSAVALNNLLVAEARANALIAAMAKALWRSRAAYAKHNKAATKRQLLASAAFASDAATALKRLPALRAAAAAALTAGGVGEVLAFDASVSAFVASVKSGGIPATLRGPLAKLGVGSTDLKHLRDGVLARSETAAAGPVLIAPLRNEARTSELQALATELSQFASRARKHPNAH